MNTPVFRMGTAADIPRLKQLWFTVFTEDPLSIVEDFLGILEPVSECCCAFVGDELVSMLFLLPATAADGQQTFSVRYLYAGCTHPTFRGRGIYGELMAFAAKQAAQSRVAAIYLHPASASLFDYYHRLGYRRGIRRIGAMESATALPYFTLTTRYAALFSMWEGDDRPADAECMWLPVYECEEIIKFMQQGAVTRLLGD